MIAMAAELDETPVPVRATAVVDGFTGSVVWNVICPVTVPVEVPGLNVTENVWLFPGCNVKGKAGPVTENLLGLTKSPFTVTARLLTLVTVIVRALLLCEVSSLVKLIEVGTTRILLLTAASDMAEVRQTNTPARIALGFGIFIVNSINEKAFSIVAVIAA